MKIFNQNLAARVKKSAFDLSHERKLSCRMGELVPVLVQEVVPGDKFSIDTQSMIRFAPMVAPVMHRINAYIHFFYVPNRILWDDWEKFVTGSPITVPTIKMTDVMEGALSDHMGLPVGEWNATTDINTLPFRAYIKIWNDYYRDQNLQAEEPLTGDVVHRDLLKRAWEKDYFTSALPWAQKGNPVTMDVNLEYKEVFLNYGPEATVEPTEGDDLHVGDNYALNSHMHAGVNPDPLYLENIGEASITVEELRRATRLQRWMERNARAGTRYVEHLLAHWGVKSSDARLQRAEYIGGGKSPVVISEVLNTTGTETLPQGNMAGHAINVGRTNQAYKFCEEHGFIIGILSVIPETSYQQGVPKFLTRKVNLDYYYPEFAQLGEQEVLNQELFYNNNPVDDLDTFGYQSRYAEYKYQQSTVHGAFKTSLDFWHMGRKFSGKPPLNAAFITANPTNRIFAVDDDTEKLYVQLYHKITAVRPMPFFNDPTL